MLGLASSTWTVIGTVSGLAGVLLLFYYGMPVQYKRAEDHLSWPTRRLKRKLKKVGV
jgi:hypothetical protein